MKYNIMPVIGGETSDIPLLPEAVSAEEVVAALGSRLKAMELQDYWRDDRGRQVPLTEVNYTIFVEEEEISELDDMAGLADERAHHHDPRGGDDK